MKNIRDQITNKDLQHSLLETDNPHSPELGASHILHACTSNYALTAAEHLS